MELSSGSDFVVEIGSGRVSFAPHVVPGAGQPVSAGFEFDVPVRFDSDELHVDLAAFAAGEIPDIPIVEIRP